MSHTYMKFALIVLHLLVLPELSVASLFFAQGPSLAHLPKASSAFLPLLSPVCPHEQSHKSRGMLVLVRAAMPGSHLNRKSHPLSVMRIVAGVVDGTGKVTEMSVDLLTPGVSVIVEVPRSFRKAVQEGANILFDGVKVVVKKVKGNALTVRILPDDLRESPLGELLPGDEVKLCTIDDASEVIV